MTDQPRRFGIVIDDHDLSDEQIRQFLVFIDNHKYFIDWHSPFRGFIVVLSLKDKKDINDNLHDYWNSEVRMIVFSLPKGAGRGALAQQTWDWLENSIKKIESD